MKKLTFIDDGCRPDLVEGARFDGVFEMPMIEKPSHFLIPKQIVPFSKRNEAVYQDAAVGFYEMDIFFSDVLAHPQKYIEDFRRFAAIISPDCSLYRDAPLAVQITNTYKNRAIGSYFQRKGLYVIPQIRWGNKYSYSTDIFPEKLAFAGIEKHSIVAIGTYGCIKHSDDKKHFKAGLESMLISLEPEYVLVYGPMPQCVFRDYLNATTFVNYDNWMKFRIEGARNGKRTQRTL